MAPLDLESGRVQTPLGPLVTRDEMVGTCAVFNMPPVRVPEVFKGLFQDRGVPEVDVGSVVGTGDLDMDIVGFADSLTVRNLDGKVDVGLFPFG